MQSTQQLRRPDTASHDNSPFAGSLWRCRHHRHRHGATLLEWIHKAGHAVATQWSGRRCVTAHIGNLHLDRPIAAGELVDLHASVVYTGRTSMHVLVTVYSRDPLRAKTLQTAQCPVIFVALDDDGVPVGVENGRRSPSSICNGSARRGCGYRCANRSTPLWPRRPTRRRAPRRARQRGSSRCAPT